MKLSISNIAWSREQDESVYFAMKQNGFTGLEIAPTRWFPEAPYEHIGDAWKKASCLKKEYGFQIVSLQSIWYGKTENIWTSEEEREELEKYTKKAVDFASALECGNLVFGCPKNRNRPEGADETEIIHFFGRLADYAGARHTVVSLEANPPIYQTNYLNRTTDALELVKSVGKAGIGINLDVGTMISNGESIRSLEEIWPYINHVHVSEPYLKPIQKRSLHAELAGALRDHGYQGYVSVEMSNENDADLVVKTMEYIAGVFG